MMVIAAAAAVAASLQGLNIQSTEELAYGSRQADRQMRQTCIDRYRQTQTVLLINSKPVAVNLKEKKKFCPTQGLQLLSQALWL